MELYSLHLLAGRFWRRFAGCFHLSFRFTSALLEHGQTCFHLHDLVALGHSIERAVLHLFGEEEQGPFLAGGGGGLFGVQVVGCTLRIRKCVRHYLSFVWFGP